MRNATLILALFVLTFTVVAQDIQLPDGNVVQGGAQTQKPADVGTLPPPPPPPALPGTSSTGNAGGNGANVNPAAGLGDDVAARAAAAMKQLGADPAKNPELFEKLVAHFQQKTTDTGVQQGSSVIQGGQAPQDASAQTASRQGAAPVAPQGQGALLAQGQAAGLGQGQGQGQALVQQGQGAAIAQTQGSTQVIGGQTSSFGSSYSSCGSCYSSCAPSYVVVQPPVYVTSYPTYYSSCSYPVFRSSSYVSIGFRHFSGRGFVGGGRLVRGR